MGMIPVWCLHSLSLSTRETREQTGGELLHGPLQGGALVDYLFCF